MNKLSEKETARKVVMVVTYLQREFTVEELDRLLAKLEREDTVMPLLDPTYWIKERSNIEALSKLTKSIWDIVTLNGLKETNV